MDGLNKSDRRLERKKQVGKMSTISPKRIWEVNWIGEGKRERFFQIVKASNLDN